MSLTFQQQQFLNRFLQTRARTKDTLGGRQLSKIKGEYEKFCKERQKLSSLIAQLKQLPRGDDFAGTHEKSLDVIVKLIDAASISGDETVFKPAYKALEEIRKACEKDIEQRKKEIKSKDEHVEKYKKELQKALGESKQDKKTQKLQSLKEEIRTWLQDHHGTDTAEVWLICDKVVAALGGPQKDDLLLAARELEARTWTLGKEIATAIETGLELATINTAYEFDTQVHQLLKDLDKYIKAAENLGDGFSLKQLQRTKAEATRLRWLVDPPPLTIDEPSQSLRVDEVEVDKDDEQEVPQVKQPEEPLSAIEQGQKALTKADSLIEHFDTEYKRVKKNYDDITGDIGELKTKTTPSQALLQVDFEMLETAMADAKLALEFAEAQLTVARDAREEAEKALEGDWKQHIAAIGGAVDTGLRELGVCEKSTGQAEGGLLYIERSFESIQSLSRRVDEIDQTLLDAVLGKIPLLPECNNTFAKNDKDRNELDLLKQLVFISALPNQKVSAVLARATDRAVLDKVIKALIEGPKHSTQEMTTTLAKCHMLCTDADRYFGSQDAFGNSLQEPAKSKFAKIKNAAKQDVAKYTIPFVLRPKKAKSDTQLNSVGVAIIGGGPIGLMAAVEARMSGASNVHVYEGRTDPYSRLNVLKIREPQMQRFRTAGIFDAIFPNGVEKDHDGLASVKTIESALEIRCGNLGIQLERGKFLKNVTRDKNGTVQLEFKGEEGQLKSCDLLIVATGASVNSAQKHADNVVLSDNLGVPFQKSSVKDYAAVGVFSKGAAPRTDGGKEQIDGWAYDFETDEVKYIVTQLTEEEYKAYCEDPHALRARIIEDAQKVKMLDRSQQNVQPPRVTTASKSETVTKDQLGGEIDRAWDQLLPQLGGTEFYGRNVEGDKEAVARAKKRALESLETTLEKKKKENKEEMVSPAFVEDVVLTFLNMELGVSRFPMEFQQAQKFMTKDLTGVLVGDSAATPHPSTAKGLNTGVDEIGSIRDLVEDLETGGGTEEERKQAMQMYEWEVKRRTDVMVNEAMEALQTGAQKRCQNLARNIWLVLNKKADYNDIKRKITDHTNTMLVQKDSPQAKGDRDWKLREAAVKNVRAFEKQILTAIGQMDTLVQTTPDGDLATHMKPFEDLFV